MNKLPTIKIKGKDYVQVKDRILYLSEEIKDYSVETDYQYFPERKLWVVKAKLIIGANSYTGLAQELESENTKTVNATSALENAETSAVGRACAMAGIGVLESIASADEVSKALNRENHYVSTAHLDPKELKPCPECGIEIVYIKAGVNKTEGTPYEAYYKCPNSCRVEVNGKTYLYRFPATQAQKYLNN